MAIKRSNLMHVPLAPLALLAASACMTPAPPQERVPLQRSAPRALPVPHVFAQSTATESLWCLTPDGERIGYPHGVCPRPAKFVRVPICAVGQSPHEETSEVRAARARAAMDGSVHGDRFQGRYFCIPHPPS